MVRHVRVYFLLGHYRGANPPLNIGFDPLQAPFDLIAHTLQFGYLHLELPAGLETPAD